MPRKKKTRRQGHGSAWHWKQTDTWYYTPRGTRRRVALLDENGQRIRGKQNKEAAQLALAKIKLAGDNDAETPTSRDSDWTVARVSSEYIVHCQNRLEAGKCSAGHTDMTSRYLNDLCAYCGALHVTELERGHIQKWVDRHKGWKSPSTARSALTIVIAAFNYCEKNFRVRNPIKGLEKPAGTPRLYSFSPDEEEAIYSVVNPALKDFLFAQIHTGLRPFCELARLTADDVEEHAEGMTWRVFSSKTGKTRKIPVLPEVATLTRKLMLTAPKESGIPLFRTLHGKAWTKVNGVHLFRSARIKLGWDKDPKRKRYSTYGCRHTYAHRTLSGYWNDGAGCSIETLAELMGDTPAVAFANYAREWGMHYRAPLLAAMGIKSKKDSA